MKLLVLLICLMCSVVYADEIRWDDLVQAIYKAEGGDKATYAYGIRSIKYKDKAEARQICMNTCRNQMKRHLRHDCGLTYLECLAKRYSPIGAKNDPEGLNGYWLRNVMRLYKYAR